MFEYIGKRHKQPIKLTQDEVNLLALIGNMGFVNWNQLNMLWSLCKRYPTTFTRSILREWSEFGGLIKVSRKQTNSRSKNTVIRTCYALTRNGREFLINQGIYPSEYATEPDVSVNSHNEQAIETVVQGLYAAMFKYQALSTRFVPGGYQKSTTANLNKPSIDTRCADGAAHHHGTGMGAVPHALGQHGHGGPVADNTHSGTTVVPGRPTRGTIKDTVTYPGGRTVPTASDKLQLSPSLSTDKTLVQSDSTKESNIPPMSLIGRPDNRPQALYQVVTTYLPSPLAYLSLLNIYRDTAGKPIDSNFTATWSSSFTMMGIDKRDNPLESLMGKSNVQVGPPVYVELSLPTYLLLNNNQELLGQLSKKSTPLGQSVPITKCGSILPSARYTLKLTDWLAIINTLQNGAVGSQANTPTLAIGHGRVIDSTIKSTSRSHESNHSKSVPDEDNQVPVQTISNEMPQRLSEVFQRSDDLISNPCFDLNNYDLSSFNHQFGNKFGDRNALPFIADMMISFQRHKRKHELYIELDNRTESNDTQIQKVINYCWYSLAHPSREIEMVIVTTDGSLTSQRLPGFTNVSRRLGNLATRIAHGFITSNGHKIYVRDLIKRATNFHIRLTGVSEAHIDIAQFLLGSNFLESYKQSVDHFVNYVNQTSSWKANFVPNKAYKYVFHNSSLLGTSRGTPSVPFKNKDTKGFFRYVPKSLIAPDCSWGWIKFTHPQANTVYKQPVLFGQEHDLDTILNIYESCGQAIETLDSNFPIIFYPWRERRLTALSLPEFKTLIDWSKHYSFSQPLYVQPRWGLNNNIQLHQELEWLLFHYHKDIHNYFAYGALNKAAQHKRTHYGDDYIDLPAPISAGKARTYTDLHQLQTVISSDDFSNQLKISEVPIGVYQALIHRWPQGLYSLPVINALPYWNNRIEELDNKVPPIISFNDCLISPNSTTLNARIHPLI